MDLQFSLSEIKHIAHSFWNSIGEKTVIAFHGPMGAGKTTFIHALCDVKDVKGSVGSPTFSIINEYEYSCEGTPKVIFHMDLFRIESAEEALQAGVQDCLYSGNLCFVEWPEKAISIFPPNTLHAYLEIINTDTRKLRIADK